MSTRKNIKMVVYLVSYICLSGVISSGENVDKEKKYFQYGKPVSGLSLSLKVQIKKVELGRVIYAIVRIKNNTDSTQQIVLTSPQRRYFFNVTNASGKEIPKLLYQKRLDEIDKGSFSRIFIRKLKSGEFLEQKFNISRRFDLSLRGNYVIQGRRKSMLHYFAKEKNSQPTQSSLPKEIYVYSPKLKFSIK